MLCALPTSLIHWNVLFTLILVYSKVTHLYILILIKGQWLEILARCVLLCFDRAFNHTIQLDRGYTLCSTWSV